MDNYVMDQIKQLLTSPQVGDDAWYDSFMEDATELFRKEISDGKTEECFNLLLSLSKNQKVRFFEAITEVQHPSLIPYLFNILPDADEILAEPIIDGLRSWNLDDGNKIFLQKNAAKHLGKSKVLDKILKSFI